jgi:hypothetical protein
MIKKIILGSLIIGVAIVNAAFGQVSAPSGIVGWWAGDGDPRDLSGNGTNGTSGTGASYSVGKVGQAFRLDGTTNSFVNVGTPATTSQNFTLEAWIRRSSATVLSNNPNGSFPNGTIFAYGSGGYGLVIDRPTNKLAVTRIGVSQVLSNTLTVTDTNWHHIAVTKSGSTLTFYLDGVSDTVTYNETFAFTTPAAIGRRGDNVGTNEFFGEVDELTQYGSVLTAAEISSIYNAGVNGKTKQAATNSGSNVQTQVNDATMTFANVSAAGTTTDYTIAPASAGTLPTGFVQTGLAYDISTTAAFSGNVQICLNLPALASRIYAVRIFHREGSSLVDRTSSTNTLTNTVCANVSSLSPFVVAFEFVRPGQIIYNRLAANANVDGTVWAIYPNGSGDHQIAVGSFPRLSPDGNYLAFKRKRAATNDSSLNYGLWVMDLRTGVEREIFYQGDYLVGFDFTPDSLKIVFDHSCNINQINVDGTGFTTVSAASCFDDFPTPRTSDGMLAFHSSSGTLHTSNANGSNRTMIPNTGTNNYYPSWSKDGQFLAYGHYDGTTTSHFNIDSLYKIKPDGSGKVVLKTLTGADRFGVNEAWSADGSKIYVPGMIGGVMGIYEVATDGSGTMSLAPDSANLIASGANVQFVGIANGFVPSAAAVSIGGRVLTPSGAGLKGAVVELSDGSGNTRTVLSSSLGYYRFDDLTAGATVLISVGSKRFQFAPRVIVVQDDLTDLDFVGEGPKGDLRMNPK